MSLRKTRRPTFSFVSGSSYVSRAFLVIKPTNWNEHIKYILGILNSKMIYFWLYAFGKKQGEQLQIDKEPLMSIPIRTIDFSVQKEVLLHNSLIQLVEHMELERDEIKKANLEEEIDQLVYQIYGLTDDEIKLVESSVKN